MIPHVCVVGAGISGLRCAAVLLEEGYDVTIVEARDRIGGRVSEDLDAISYPPIDNYADCPKRSDGTTGCGHVSN